VANIPLRPCSIPGCPSLTSRGRCDAHRRESDALRGSSAERGYDADHRRLRILCFVRDGWRCVDCGWEPEIVEQFRSFGLGAPPTDLVLAELRHRHNRGERHLHADHQVPIEQRPRICGSISTTSGPGAIGVTWRRPVAGVRRGEGVGGLIFTIARAKRPWATLVQKSPGFELFQLWTTK
jgi:hypothetical protein